jgi:prolyl-tRNA synthetase
MSKFNINTVKDVSQEHEALNAKLLIQGGFIKQELAGVYTYTGLGFQVLKNIEDITRKHMRRCGEEILMPSLHPTKNWEDTGRINSLHILFEARGANKESRQLNDSRYILGPTHEEIVTPLAKNYIKSYRDLPLSLFQIQTKFRNEARPKSGLLRGREFRMKDLYSFHENSEGLKEFYEMMKVVYMDLFNELGIGEDTYVTLASGGDFTSDFSHEFQTLLPNGEDLIYLDREGEIAYNQELITSGEIKSLDVDIDKLEKVRASEVGNIFPLHLKYSEAFDLTYVDREGNIKPVYMGCYGIGTSRLMGVIAEKFADENGLVWPENVAPAKYHIVSLFKDEKDESYKKSEDLYRIIGEDAIWDNRKNVSTGVKLKDADLIGCPYRVVVSPKSIENGGVEVKGRRETDSVIISSEEMINRYGVARRI